MNKGVSCTADNDNQDDDNCCAICLEPVEKNKDRESVALDCNHWFHVKCLKNLRNPACPTCRAPIESINEHLNEEDVAKMRKRQRDDNEEAIVRGLSQYVSQTFIAPGTPLFGRVLTALLDRLNGSAQRLACLNEERAHHFLHHGVLANENLPCSTVRDVVSRICCFFGLCQQPDFCRFLADNLVEPIVQWVMQRVPDIHPQLLWQLQRQQFPEHSLHQRIASSMIAWQRLIAGHFVQQLASDYSNATTANSENSAKRIKVL